MHIFLPELFSEIVKERMPLNGAQVSYSSLESVIYQGPIRVSGRFGEHSTREVSYC